MRIGIIAGNQQEGKEASILLSPEHDIHILTMPNHPKGLRLDVILYTDNARSNHYYDEIVRNSQLCLEQ